MNEEPQPAPEPPALVFNQLLTPSFVTSLPTFFPKAFIAPRKTPLTRTPPTTLTGSDKIAPPMFSTLACVEIPPSLSVPYVF